MTKTYDYEEASKQWRHALEQRINNAVKVRIYPLDLPDEPISEWAWHVKITIPNNQWEDSDEDGNFIIHRSGIDAFYSLDNAFAWSYKWLKGRGYDLSSIELNLDSIFCDGIIKKQPTRSQQ
jgi:hypothetical protein